MIFPKISFDAVIFDCDGTLVDTMPLFFQAWRDSLQRYGSCYDFKWEYFRHHGGQSPEETLTDISRESGETIDFSTIQQLQEEFLSTRWDAVKPILPVVTFAQTCYDRGQPIAVASSGYRKFVLKTLQGVGVSEYFSVIVTREDVKRLKPHPDLFLLAAEQLNVDPGYCLVVEDSPLGLLAASSAGMASYYVPTFSADGL